MALNAEVLTSYKQIDEAYIDELLKKEIEKAKILRKEYYGSKNK